MYSSEAEEKIFQEKWRTKPTAPGRFFNFEALQSHPLEIKAYTDFQGWSSFLSLRETYYPRLIQAFYFKAKCDRKNCTFRTNVKGVEFEINPDVIADIFKIPNDGFMSYGKNWYSLAKTTFEEVRTPIFTLESPKDSRKTSDLNFLPKIFHIITQGSVLPRQGKYAELDDNEIMVIHHLFERKKLNLPFLMINFMMDVASKNNKKFCVSYGMTLTKIFDHFKVPFEGEIAETEHKKFSLKNLKHFKIEPISQAPVKVYTRAKRKRNEQYDDTAQSQQIPEPFVENDFVPNPFFARHPAETEIPQNEAFISSSSSQMLGPRAEINLNIPLAYPQNESPIEAAPQPEPQLAPILAETQLVNQPDPNSVLEHFTTSSTSAPLFSSPPSFNLSPMFNESFNNHFFNFSPPQNPFSQPFFTQNISIHSPTLNLPNIANFNAGPSNIAPRPTPQLPRSKVERNTSKTRSDVKKLFKAVQILDSHLTYITLENSIMRDWISNIFCERFNLPKTPLNPYPIPVHVMPQPSTSSSSDGSSPSRPAP
ncbi:hypothetical protein L195_g025437 [Trifolium pratense]|uniref:Putative plant transposon protein domain-containing protein n=1 Tax=Trifolium pratense TaxID=57577 RepID=A0A2K3NGH4_TRIPR|nr:hypothetical protein L195_g025437 [Trifolium pratense]